MNIKNNVYKLFSGDSNNFQRYGTLSYLREEISWKLAVSVKSMEDRSRKGKRTKVNALRRVVDCKEQYYSSQEGYIPRDWSIPVLLDDSHRHSHGPSRW